ncbi:MAG: AAA family ATPase, partial [Candidatus Competibacterales bacterium]
MIPLAQLPVALDDDAAVEAVYGGELDDVADKLLQGLSVRIEGDKQLTFYLYRALRRRLKGRLTLRLLAGQARSEEPQGLQTLMQRLLNQLQEAVFSGEGDQVIVLPHLDVLTTTTRSGLSAETREAAALLYEDPEAVFLAFKDPSFELPAVIDNVFPVHRSLVGLPRQRLPAIITRGEARKLAVDTFNPHVLYKYLSGLNAVRCRQILGHFQDRLDYDPARPETAAAIYREIRQLTVAADVALPQVDLDADIGGYDEVKTRLKQDILALLARKEQTRDPATARQIERLVPKGLIFHGPPGTGKTFFAKALATALDAAVIVVSGPELKSKWVGESEQQLRQVFAKARQSAPAIIVFDELDSFAVPREREMGSGVEHSMVNQLLTEMDGFRPEETVLVVGTTNFLDGLDPALLRPGRFELTLEIPYPDAAARRAIVDISRRQLGLDFEAGALEHIVQVTGGFVDRVKGVRYSGDHLYALAKALKREELRSEGPLTVTPALVDQLLGVSRPIPLQAQERRTVAVHEAGHALLAYILPHCPTIETITLAKDEGPGEGPLGAVVQAARTHRYVTTESELLDDICVLLGGRLAEALLLGQVSMGAHHDLQRASEIARMMVEELAMGELGLLTYVDAEVGVSVVGGARRPRGAAPAAALAPALPPLVGGPRPR